MEYSACQSSRNSWEKFKQRVPPRGCKRSSPFLAGISTKLGGGESPVTTALFLAGADAVYLLGVKVSLL